MSPAVWAAALLLALTACSDGYQGDGEPLRLHYDMTRQEALEAMDRVAHLTPGGGSAFALLEHCVLQWRLGQRVVSTPLPGTQAVLTKQTETERYRVQLTTAAGAEETSEVPLLDNAAWTEATQMKWLLDYVRRFC